MLLATYTLWLREIVRFYRQRSRIVGALGSPLVFWFLIGSGLGRSFQTGAGTTLRGGYLEYFYPGTLALIVLFTAIFSTISIIEDRQEGFLQGVLAAPVPRAAIALGKILGAATLALMQAVVFLLFAPLAHIRITTSAVPEIVAILIVIAIGLSGIGFLLAWRLNSTQGFHAIMNLFLIPMWILSGALFPASGAAAWVRGLMLLNPLTYGVSALRAAFYGSGAFAGDPTMGTSVVVISAFAMGIFAVSTWLVTTER